MAALAQINTQDQNYYVAKKALRFQTLFELDISQTMDFCLFNDS